MLNLIILFCGCVYILAACSTAPTLSPVNVDSNGVAIKGYDPVAYFTMDSPVKGKTEFQMEWNNAKWLFENKDHLEMFRKNPRKFAPQYGGY
jgi:YHS domain-containing protein